MSAAELADAGALVPSISIENLLRVRDGAIDRYRQIVKLAHEIDDMLKAVKVSPATVYLSGSGYRDDGSPATADDALPGVLKTIDASAWQRLMNESGLRTLMDAKAREAWDKQIYDKTAPELTRETIEATFEALHNGRGEMFERGVLSCFKSLSWDYKTNRPFGFGKRIVLRFLRGQVIAGRYTTGTMLGSPCYRTCDKLDDLVRVMMVLDGKIEPDHRQGWSSRLHVNDRTTDEPAEDDYLSVRSFRNGNGHVTFKRPDLVDKMNRILAKHYPNALPAPQK